MKHFPLNKKHTSCYQLDLFNDAITKENLSKAMDKIYTKFGVTNILRASSLTKAGQALVRSKKIGGHFK